MKKEIKLIVADVDGTLIDDNEMLPENFQAVVDQLQKRDIIFVVASGRSFDSIEKKINYKAENIHIIADNGAFLKYKGELLYQNSFSKSEVIEITNIFRKCEEASILGSLVDSSRFELFPGQAQDFLTDFWPKYKLVEDLTKCDEDFIKMGMFSMYNSFKNYQLAEVQALKENYHLVRTGPQWINIMKKGSSKGHALEVLLDKLNISHENTIGFGDFPNDIEMLKLVKKSYAMENSDPNVIKIADEVIGSNNDNSVLKKIIELLNLEI